MYLELLRLPRVGRLVLGALVARVPLAMVWVSTVLLVQRKTGSFAIAGAVEACASGTLAVCAPLLGRVVDALGQPRVLLAAAAVHSTALAGLVAATLGGAPAVALCVLAATAGAAAPPVSGAIRALWPSLVAGTGVPLSVAFGLESVSVEAFFILGPLLAGALIALASPAASVLCAAGLVLAGVVIFATSPASRAWRPSGRPGSLAGALASPGMRVLVGATLPLGMGFGLLGVALAGFAVREGAPAAAGVLWAAQAVGSAVGGLWYGTRRWRRSPSARFVIVIGLYALGLLPLALAPSIPVLMGLIALGSLTLAPFTATGYELVDRTAPAGTATEAYTWLITANVAGSALGSAVSGTIVQHAGPAAAFLAAAGVTALGAVVALAARTRLTLRSSPSPSP